MSAWKLVEAVPEESPAKPGNDQQSGRGAAGTCILNLIFRGFLDNSHSTKAYCLLMHSLVVNACLYSTRWKRRWARKRRRKRRQQWWSIIRTRTRNGLLQLSFCRRSQLPFSHGCSANVSCLTPFPWCRRPLTCFYFFLLLQRVHFQSRQSLQRHVRSCLHG